MRVYKINPESLGALLVKETVQVNMLPEEARNLINALEYAAAQRIPSQDVVLFLDLSYLLKGVL